MIESIIFSMAPAHGPVKKFSVSAVTGKINGVSPVLRPGTPNASAVLRPQKGDLPRAAAAFWARTAKNPLRNRGFGCKISLGT